MSKQKWITLVSVYSIIYTIITLLNSVLDLCNGIYEDPSGNWHELDRAIRYDWTLPFVQGTAARSLTNIDAITLVGQVGAGIQYDQAAQSPFFRYYDGDGRQHEVWFEDARSLRAKYALVNEYGLAGVSFWNLNNLFRTNFLTLESMFTVEKVL